MNKIHTGQNKSLVNSTNTKIYFKPIIDRINFVIKILYGVRILI